jgi:hypothetical protein
MGEGRKVSRVLVGKPEGNSPLDRLRSRCEDGIRIDLGGIGWGLWSGSVLLWIGTGGGLSGMRC